MGQSESMALKLSMRRPCKEHLKMELGNGDTIVEGAFFNECNEDKESAGAEKCKSLNLKDFIPNFSMFFLYAVMAPVRSHGKQVRISSM